MSAAAKPHIKRQPLNFAAPDLSNALTYNGEALRDLIDHYRERMHAHQRRLSEGTELLCRNPRHRLAVHPDVEAAALRRTTSLLKYLLQLAQQTGEGE